MIYPIAVASTGRYVGSGTAVGSDNPNGSDSDTVGDRVIRKMYIAMEPVPQTGVWQSHSVHCCSLEAGLACLREFLPQWRTIGEEARTLRTLLEHPAVSELKCDDIDGEILLQRASDLTRRIDSQDAMIERLLDKPCLDDQLVVQKEHEDRIRALLALETDGGDDDDDQRENAAYTPYEEFADFVQLREELNFRLEQLDEQAVIFTRVFLRSDIADALDQELVDGLFAHQVDSILDCLDRYHNAMVSTDGIENAMRVAHERRRKLASKRDMHAARLREAVSQLSNQPKGGKVIQFVTATSGDGGDPDADNVRDDGDNGSSSTEDV